MRYLVGVPVFAIFFFMIAVLLDGNFFGGRLFSRGLKSTPEEFRADLLRILELSTVDFESWPRQTALWFEDFLDVPRRDSELEDIRRTIEEPARRHRNEARLHPDVIISLERAVRIVDGIIARAQS